MHTKVSEGAECFRLEESVWIYQKLPKVIPEFELVRVQMGQLYPLVPSHSVKNNVIKRAEHHKANLIKVAT